MFPNLRLMIVAVLASILGISCALGLFAEFRVSHDSVLRESNASAPLQLGSGDAAPGRIVDTSAPFEFRFQAPPPPVAMEAAGRPETLDHVTVVETPQPVPLPPPEPETAAASAGAASAPATAPNVTSATEPAAVPAPSDHAAEAPSPASTGAIADQNSEQQTPQNSRQNTEPEAEGDLAVRSPAASLPVGTTVPNAEIAPASAPAAAPEKRRRTTLRHRPVIVRRSQRTRPAALIQDFTALQPPFQWTLQSASQSPQPPRRRIIRRIRPARKPVVQTATPQTAVSNTSPVDPPE